MRENAERDAKILRLYNEGRKVEDIAVAVDMASNSVGRILRGLGIKRPSKPQKRWGGREDKTKKIVALWDQGLCASQIAERLAETMPTVNYALRKSGIRRRQQPRHRYDSATPGGSGRSGFAASMARKT
jgi:hypothetical protein